MSNVRQEGRLMFNDRGFFVVAPQAWNNVLHYDWYLLVEHAVTPVALVGPSLCLSRQLITPALKNSTSNSPWNYGIYIWNLHLTIYLGSLRCYCAWGNDFGTGVTRQLSSAFQAFRQKRWPIYSQSNALFQRSKQIVNVCLETQQFFIFFFKNLASRK